MKKNYFFTFVAALFISGSMMAENTVVLVNGEVEKEFATLEEAVDSAVVAGQGIIKLLPAYNRYPQAWLGDLEIDEPTGYDDKQKALYTFHAFNPNNGDEGIFEMINHKEPMESADSIRAKEVIMEINPLLKGHPEMIDLAEDFKKLGGYGDWRSDFEVHFDANVDSATYTLAGNYGDWGWYPNAEYGCISVSLPKDSIVCLLNNDFAPKRDEKLHYYELMTKVFQFHCGIINLDAAANAGKKFIVDLYLYKLDNDKVKILLNSTEFKFENPSTSVENMSLDASCTKAMKNGQLIIIRNGVRYNVQGAEIQ